MSDRTGSYDKKSLLDIWSKAERELTVAQLIAEAVQGAEEQASLHVLRAWHLLEILRQAEEERPIDGQNSAFCSSLPTEKISALTFSLKEWRQCLPDGQEHGEKSKTDGSNESAPDFEEVRYQIEALSARLRLYERRWRRKFLNDTRCQLARKRRIGFLSLTLALGYFAVSMLCGSWNPVNWFDDHYGEFILAEKSQGWGMLMKDNSVDGNTLSCAGAKYAKGLGTHANSSIHLLWSGDAQSLSGEYCVDDEVGSKGSVVFQILSGDTVLFSSALVKGREPAQPFSVQVKGLNSLRLKADGGDDGIGSDHANWLNLRLTR